MSNPRDKRCIITEISRDDGSMMDIFTLEDTGEIREAEDGVLGHMQGIVMTTISLDFD